MRNIGDELVKIIDPIKRMNLLSYRGFYNRMSDKRYLQKRYKLIFKKNLNLDCPKTFNEKLQWLKLYDRRPEYTMMVDKYEVREYIENIIGRKYLIPLLGVWNNAEEINVDKLPDQFVLKTTHDSGSVYICKDKKSFDWKVVFKGLKKSLDRNFYYHGREWPYKNVKPRIIAEKYMVDESGYELKDYKLMCFNGKVKCSFVCMNRGASYGLNVDFYDLDWNLMPFERHYPQSEYPIKRPYNYDKMIELAEQLSKDIPFVRVDFYEVDKKLYFGELTFYPGSGFEEFTPEEWDYTLGSWLELPKKRGQV